MALDESKQAFSPKRVGQKEEKTFSPISVQESPVSKTSQRGNLTGNPRKIRDDAAELYNLTQEWNINVFNGSEILLKINSLKGEFEKNEKFDFQKCYPEGLQNLCDELDKLCEQMSEIVAKMIVTKTEVEGVIKLEKLKKSSETPMFLTWPADVFGESWLTIVEAYEKELCLKMYIKENVAHTTNIADTMFFIASWVHQPYIDHNVSLRIEALLKETGHR